MNENEAGEFESAEFLEAMIGANLLAKEALEVIGKSARALSDAEYKFNGLNDKVAEAAAHAVKDCTRASLEPCTDKLQSQINTLINVANAIDDHTDKIRFHNLIIINVGFLLVSAVLVLGVFLWIPPMKEIEERRATLEELDQNITTQKEKIEWFEELSAVHFQRCYGSGLCVKVHTKQCFQRQGKGKNASSLCLVQPKEEAKKARG